MCACKGCVPFELSFASEVTWGAAVGHSTGDLLAAYACGLGRQEALKLLHARAAAAAAQAEGAMAAVRQRADGEQEEPRRGAETMAAA